MNAVDVVYFGFSEKRLTHELFSTTGGDLFNMPIGETVVETRASNDTYHESTLTRSMIITVSL